MGKDPRLSRVVIRGPMDGSSGYAQHVTGIVRGLAALKVQPIFRPIGLDWDSGNIHPVVLENIVEDEPCVDSDLLIHIPGVNPSINGNIRRVHWTTWETTYWPREHLPKLEGVEAVIVSCEWNLNCLSASGLTKPIYVVHEGIDTDFFHYKDVEAGGTTVFGASGRLGRGSAHRKQLGAVIRAFKRAFSEKDDVQLRIKLLSKAEVERLDPDGDPRIKLDVGCYTQEELRDWYHGLTVFVSASASEAWGLHLHEAMSCGRAVVSQKFGGIAEYLDEECGYPVRYSYVPAAGTYAGMGLWSEANEDHLVERLREVHQDRAGASARGINANYKMSKFTYKRMAENLLPILDHHRITI